MAFRLVAKVVASHEWNYQEENHQKENHQEENYQEDNYQEEEEVKEIVFPFVVWSKSIKLTFQETNLNVQYDFYLIYG